MELHLSDISIQLIKHSKIISYIGVCIYANHPISFSLIGLLQQ